MGAWIGIGLLVAAAILLLVRHDAGTIAGFDNADFAGIMALLALLIFLGGGLLRGYRGRLTGALRDAVMWGLLALALIAGYSYRDEIKPIALRVAGELMPGTPLAVTTNGETPAVRIRRVSNGHFTANTVTNGVKITMVVDTGASSVVLTQSDANRAGINVDTLNYSVPMQTANGVTFGARVQLRNVSVGTLSVDGVEALVARPGALRESLLGMSFLSRLRSYEFSGDFLTLRG